MWNSIKNRDIFHIMNINVIKTKWYTYKRPLLTESIGGNSDWINCIIVHSTALFFQEITGLTSHIFVLPDDRTVPRLTNPYLTLADQSLFCSSDWQINLEDYSNLETIHTIRGWSTGQFTMHAWTFQSIEDHMLKISLL